MAMHNDSKNFNVSHSTLHGIVQFDGIYRATFNCAINQEFSGKEEKELIKICKLLQECIMEFLST
jgi:hypothetical protein